VEQNKIIFENKLAAPAASALEVIRRQPKSDRPSVHPIRSDDRDRYDTEQAHALGREGFNPASGVQPDHGFNTHVSSDVR
jgi:hypothetical protein